MTEALRDTSTWWGTFELEVGQAGCWEIGPSTLWIGRLEKEWRIVQTQDTDPLRDAFVVRVPTVPDELNLALESIPDESTLSRFSFERTQRLITLRPVLADRAIVLRPETPLYVTEGESITLYVSTPVWIRFEAGDAKQFLRETPTYRPSDTWFGPSPREGELCYAGRTLGRIRLADLPRRIARAVTPIQLHNRAGDPWLIERIQLPVQYLGVYHAEGNGLWTQGVTLAREKDGQLAELHIGEGLPKEAAGATLLSPPRFTLRSNVIVRTISTLFSRIREA